MLAIIRESLEAKFLEKDFKQKIDQLLDKHLEKTIEDMVKDGVSHGIRKSWFNQTVERFRQGVKEHPLFKNTP